MQIDRKFEMQMKHIASGIVATALIAVLPLAVTAQDSYAPADLEQKLSTITTWPPAELENTPNFAPSNAPVPQYAPTQQFGPAPQYSAPPQFYGNAPNGGYGGYVPNYAYGGNPGGYYGNTVPYGYGNGTPYGNGFGGLPFGNNGFGSGYGNVPSGGSPFFGNSSPFGFW